MANEVGNPIKVGHLLGDETSVPFSNALGNGSSDC